MLDNELMEQFQLLAAMVEQSEQRMTERIDESRRHTEIIIENTITKRIDALFDGYKLTHEKQYELERQNNALKAEVDDIKRRLSVLENKTA